MQIFASKEGGEEEGEEEGDEGVEAGWRQEGEGEAGGRLLARWETRKTTDAGGGALRKSYKGNYGSADSPRVTSLKQPLSPSRVHAAWASPQRARCPRSSMGRRRYSALEAGKGAGPRRD